MRETDKELKACAARLKLTFIRDNLEDLLKTATENKMTVREALAFLFGEEIRRRNANRCSLWMSGAHFPVIKELRDFDLTFQPSIDPGLFREMCSLEWVGNGENVVLVGPPGVGKTHLAIGLGVSAVRAGMTVRFFSAKDLIEVLSKAYSEGVFENKLKEINKSRLLIIDELGYTPLSPVQTQLLYHLVALRYEKKSVIVTSNRPAGQWELFMGDKAASNAILDRLLHHCTAIAIKGESYRIHEGRMRKFKKTKAKEVGAENTQTS
ncbi:IS21-like element helper ATPase IstB [Mesosutterella sp. AGMB02718]|uniref:IS21-like element helper ATPase IstB n=1 Tax=Mesosutterella faecium TaxID=2925194 RepID=A0ABT7INW8_9BURK|nr:IS21-like element helper ATPase IstB [Mesosutterella sp. AGMB02718]MDL2060074.1 IS21-like element helper ATPase IstB [Mesosutterella sp. AGMB02718]